MAQIFQQIRIAESNNILISFCWNRGHSGVLGNEIADGLAKPGARSHRSIDYDLIPVSYIKKLIHNKIIDEWNNKWTTAETGSMTRKFFPTVYHRIETKKFFTTDYYMTQLLTNHGKFDEYLTRFQLQNDMTCRHCRTSNGNADHILFQCQYFQQQRLEIIDYMNHSPQSYLQLISENYIGRFKQFCKAVLI